MYYRPRIEKPDNEVEFDNQHLKKLSVEQSKGNEFRIRTVDPPDCQAAGIHKESLMINYKEKYFADDDIETNEGK